MIAAHQRTASRRNAVTRAPTLSSIKARRQGISKATTGVRTARDSAATIPNVSYLLGMATTSAEASNAKRFSLATRPMN